jgi:transcriptional regulator with XRE-family HTH domain
MLCCMAGSTRTNSGINLGAALRTVREERGVSQRKLADAIGRDPGLVSRWESGERQAKPADVTQICEALGIDAERTADLINMAGQAGQPQWLAVTLPERRAQLNALLAAERTATAVIQNAPLIIPGVLQTSDVIRSIMVDGGVPASEIDERVAVRIGRRDLITRRNPAHLEVFLGEAALRTIIGNPQIMADQLHYLVEHAEMENVDIRVVAFKTGWTAALVGEFIYLDGDPAIVNIEMQGSGLILHGREDLDTYRRAAAEVREKAMSSEATAELIAEVISELEKQDDNTT